MDSCLCDSGILTVFMSSCWTKAIQFICRIHIMLIRSNIRIWMGFILHAELEYSLCDFISGNIVFSSFPFSSSSSFSSPMSIPAPNSCCFSTNTAVIWSFWRNCTLRFLLCFCYSFVCECSPGENTWWHHKKMNGVKNLIAVGCMILSPCCFHWKPALYQHATVFWFIAFCK